MIDINNLNDVSKSIGEQSQAKHKTGKSSDAFDNVLNSAMETTQTSQSSEVHPGLSEISAPGFEIESLSSVVTDKTDMLIGLLEAYAGKLENTDVSLKMMAPVIEEINARADALMQETSLLGDEDSQLKTIATEAAVTARTEYEKFQRGDYLG